MFTAILQLSCVYRLVRHRRVAGIVLCELELDREPVDHHGYNIYRATVSGGPYAQLNSSVLATTQYQDSDIQLGQTYYYVVNAVDSSGDESQYSNETTVSVPTSKYSE